MSTFSSGMKDSSPVPYFPVAHFTHRLLFAFFFFLCCLDQAELSVTAHGRLVLVIIPVQIID